MKDPAQNRRTNAGADARRVHVGAVSVAISQDRQMGAAAD